MNMSLEICPYCRHDDALTKVDIKLHEKRRCNLSFVRLYYHCARCNNRIVYDEVADLREHNELERIKVNWFDWRGSKAVRWGPLWTPIAGL